MVYIDASHFYKDVLKNIEEWLPRVRQGGIIGGHDYGSNRHAGVKQAVDERFGADKIQIHPGLVWTICK
jgi:hypothetical protein